MPAASVKRVRAKLPRTKRPSTKRGARVAAGNDLLLAADAGSMLRRWRQRVVAYLPSGGTLTRAERLQRHRAILVLLWIHAVALFAFGMLSGHGVVHSLGDALKIDKSFVRNLATDPSDRAIVRSAVELGHNLGLQVVAEGVEDTLGYQQLSKLGCDLAQGYYMGKPMPVAELEDWLAAAPFGLALKAAA